MAESFAMPIRPARPPAVLPRRRGLRAAAAMVLMLPLGGGLAACAGASAEQGEMPASTAAGGPGVIEGTVTYRERIALSPGALLEIALFDVTDSDLRSRPIAKQLYADIGQVPVRFAFAYDPAAVAPDRSYALVARILEGEQPVFLTLRHEPVLTGGADAEVELLLARAPGG